VTELPSYHQNSHFFGVFLAELTSMDPFLERKDEPNIHARHLMLLRLYRDGSLPEWEDECITHARSTGRQCLPSHQGNGVFGQGVALRGSLLSRLLRLQMRQYCKMKCVSRLFVDRSSTFFCNRIWITGGSSSISYPGRPSFLWALHGLVVHLSR
jgi:hypothetical protein